MKIKEIETQAQEFFGETLEIVTARNMLQYWWPEIQRYLHGRDEILDKPAARSLFRLGLITRVRSRPLGTRLDFTPFANDLIKELKLEHK